MADKLEKCICVVVGDVRGVSYKCPEHHHEFEISPGAWREVTGDIDDLRAMAKQASKLMKLSNDDPDACPLPDSQIVASLEYYIVAMANRIEHIRGELIECTEQSWARAMAAPSGNYESPDRPESPRGP